MRCKRHPSENGIGVCAPCLRGRLLALHGDQADDTPDHSRKPEPPPRLQFPRSVSRRRSANPAHRRLSSVFFSPPRVGPSSSTTAAAAGCRRWGSGKLSLLSSLFGLSKSEKTEPDHLISETPRSSSWFSVLVRGHRKKKNSRLFAAEEAAERTSCHATDRGMSPDTDCSASGNECASESPGRWRRSTRSPMRRPAAYQHHHRSGGLAGFAVCLSPLVRVSPGHRRIQEAVEVGFSGELRSTPKPHHRRHASGGVASLGPGRSRKLVDFGRFR